MLAEECSNDWRDIDADIATNIFYVEKELGAYIDDNYPLAKLNYQIEALQEHMKREQEETNKMKNRRGLR